MILYLKMRRKRNEHYLVVDVETTLEGGREAGPGREERRGAICLLTELFEGENQLFPA